MGGGIWREAVLGGRRYWKGGGIGREALLGGRPYWEGRLYLHFPMPSLRVGFASLIPNAKSYPSYLLFGPDSHELSTYIP